MNGAQWLSRISVTVFAVLATTVFSPEASATGTAGASRPATAPASRSRAASQPMSRVVSAKATAKATGICVPLVPAIAASPPGVAFPAIAQDLASNPVAITLTNTGTAGLKISGLTTRDIPINEGSDFRVLSDNCTGTIPPGGSCTVNVEFRAFGNPGQTINGALDVFSNVPGPPVSIPLSGIVGVPAITSASLLDFGAVSASPPLTSTLPLSITNTGTISVAITSAFWFPSPEFTLAAGTCPLVPPPSPDGVNFFTLAPGSGCALDVTFAPGGSQFFSGYAYIGYADAATPANELASSFTSLQGLGIGFGGSLIASPPTLLLGDQTQNVSTSSSVTLTNLEAANQVISFLTSTPELTVPPAGDFCSAANLPAGLAPGASCTFDVRIDRAGLAAGSYNPFITVIGSVSGSSTVFVPFGVLPALQFAPASFDFGIVPYLGSATQTFTLTNSDPSGYTFPVSVPPFALFPPFSATGGTCGLVGFTLNPGQSCTVDVTFAPTPADGGPFFNQDGYVVAPPPSNEFIYLNVTGTVSGPQLSVSDSFIDFGTDNTGVSSIAFTVTVTNDGDQPAASISVSSDNPTEFTVENNLCTGPVAAFGGTCTFDVRYLRATQGFGFANIQVDTVPPFSPVSIFVAGTAATPPPAQLDYFYAPSTASPLTFPPTVVGIASAPLEISLGNTGGLPLDLGNVVSSAPGEFAVVSTCPIAPAGSVAPGACCLLTVTFTPIATGARAATITVLDPLGATLATILLAGDGTSPAAPGIVKQFSPNPIQPGGISMLAITITNPNAFPLTSASFTDAFPAGLVVAPTPAVTNTCGGTAVALAGGSSVSLAGGTIPAAAALPGTCAVTVQVTAASVSPGLVNNIPPGAAVGGLFTAETTAAPPATDTLVVSSVPSPSVVLNPASLSFGTQTLFVPSALQTLAVQNVGNAALNVFSVSVSGDFATQTACVGVPIPPAGQCTIDVRFTPIIGGLRSGQVVVASDAPGTPHIASLSGTGVILPLPNVSLSPISLAFPATTAGQVSAPLTVTLTNTGGGPLSLFSVDMVGSGFAQSNNCGTTVASLASCQIQVVFSPPAAGSYGVTLRIVSDATGSPHFVGVTGSATAAPVGRLTASPASLSFSDQIVGTTSAAQGFTLSNTGAATTSVSQIAVTGDFALEGSCFDLLPGQSCALRATFTPTVLGTRSGQVVVTSDAANSPFGIALNGRGVPVPAPRVSLSATGLGFGNTLVGTPAMQAFTVTNSGAANLILGAVEVNGDFRIVNGCSGTLVPGGSCRIDVTFMPSIPGMRLGEVRILSNANGSPHRVDLTGTGCRLSLTGRAFDLICSP